MTTHQESDRVSAAAEAVIKRAEAAAAPPEPVTPTEGDAINQLGRIDEIRAVLQRAVDTFMHAVMQVQDRLDSLMGPQAEPKVSDAAKAVSDAFDLDYHKKRRSPAATGPAVN